MTVFASISLINCITCFLIGCFLLYKSHRNPVHVAFCVFDFCVAFYAFFYFLWQVANVEEHSIFFFKLCIFGVVLINSAFINFTCVILGLWDRFKYKLFAIHGINAFFAIASFFLFYNSWTEKFGYGIWPIPSNLFHAYLSWWFIQVFYSFYLLYRYGIARPEAKVKRQFQWVFWSTFIAYAGGATNWLVWYDINFPPYLNSGIAIYTLVLVYAIFRYQLLGIEVLIRKTLVFAGLLGFVFAVFSAATFLVREVLSVYFGISNTLTYTISIFLIVLGYDHIRNLLVDLTDRYLFQKKYDYQKLLKDASKGISKIESLDHLFRLVTHFITMRIRVKNAAILAKKSENGDFTLEYQRGYTKNYLSYRLKRESPLIYYLTKENEAIDLDRLEEFVSEGGKHVKGEDVRIYDFEGIKKQMADLEANCCVPSFLGKELRNILVMGPKKSGKPYTDEDINVLFTLAQESAIAIENARLYDEAIKKAHELETINEALEGAKSSLTQALSDTERANKQLQDTQAQLIHEQKMATLGRLAASVGHEVNNPLTILSMNVSRAILKYRKNNDLKVGEVLDIFQKMEQNINRIKAVVNTLTGLLKKSEKGKFEPLSLKLILEETLPLVQFQTYLDNLAGTEVEFNVPGNVPLVRGDLERLQEVFLNLFINAYHAMSGRRNPRIQVKAELSPDNPKLVAVHFQDNGKGMSEETRKKIFNYGFTTKPPGKGSGLGLYMCKYIIELHGGDMKVTSTPDVGTTFTLTLPIYEEEGLSGTQEERTGS